MRSRASTAATTAGNWRATSPARSATAGSRPASPRSGATTAPRPISSTAQRFFVAPALSWDITPDTKLTLLAYYQNDEIDGVSSGFLPAQGTLLPNPNGPIPVERNVGEPDYNLFSREQYGIGYDFSHRFNEHFTVKQNLKYSQQDENFVSIYGAGFVDDDFNGVPGRLPDHQPQQLPLPRVHPGVLGRHPRRDPRPDRRGPAHRARRRRLPQHAATTPTSASASALRCGSTSTTRSTASRSLPLDFPLGPSVRRQDTQIGIYAQDQMALGGWRLTLTGRHDWLDTDSFGADFSDDTAFTGRVGLNYIFEQRHRALRRLRHLVPAGARRATSTARPSRRPPAASSRPA